MNHLFYYRCLYSFHNRTTSLYECGFQLLVCEEDDASSWHLLNHAHIEALVKTGHALTRKYFTT